MTSCESSVMLLSARKVDDLRSASNNRDPDTHSSPAAEASRGSRSKLWSSLKLTRNKRKHVIREVNVGQGRKKSSSMKFAKIVSTQKTPNTVGSDVSSADNSSLSNDSKSVTRLYDVINATQFGRKGCKGRCEARRLPALDSLSSWTCFCGECDVTTSDDDSSIITTDSDVSTSSSLLSSSDVELSDVITFEFASATRVPPATAFPVVAVDDVDKLSVLAQFLQRMRVPPPTDVARDDSDVLSSNEETTAAKQHSQDGKTAATTCRNPRTVRSPHNSSNPTENHSLRRSLTSVDDAVTSEAQVTCRYYCRVRVWRQASVISL